jgi:hypothetical protein
MWAPTQVQGIFFFAFNPANPRIFLVDPSRELKNGDVQYAMTCIRELFMYVRRTDRPVNL